MAVQKILPNSRSLRRPSRTGAVFLTPVFGNRATSTGQDRKHVAWACSRSLTRSRPRSGLEAFDQVTGRKNLNRQPTGNFPQSALDVIAANGLIA